MIGDETVAVVCARHGKHDMILFSGSVQCVYCKRWYPAPEFKLSFNIDKHLEWCETRLR